MDFIKKVESATILNAYAKSGHGAIDYKREHASKSEPIWRKVQVFGSGIPGLFLMINAVNSVLQFS